MRKRDKSKEIKNFIAYITTVWGLLTGITAFFPNAFVLLKINLISDEIRYRGDGVELVVVASALTTLVCIFVIYYSFVQRHTFKQINPQQALNCFLFGFVSLSIFLLLMNFYYILRDLLANVLSVELSSADDFVLMLVGIVPFYITFFALVTRRFTTLALIEFER